MKRTIDPKDNKSNCYVCLQPINNPKKAIHYAPTPKQPNGGSRHKSCAVGTSKWFNSEIAKKSEFRKYYEKTLKGKKQDLDKFLNSLKNKEKINDETHNSN